MSNPITTKNRPATDKPPGPRMRRSRLAIAIILAVVAAGVVVVLASGGSDPAPDAGTAPDADTGGPGAAPDAVAPPAAVDLVRLPGRDQGYPSPFAYVKGPGLIRANLLFDTLLWKDASGEMIPWLAESWEHSADGTRWTFTLREGITWHDGQPLTAEDVVFTYEYVTTGPGADFLGVVAKPPITGVSATDERTVVFTTPRPLATFEDAVAGRVLIVPRHVWDGVAEPNKLRGDEAVMGSGPYTLVSYDQATGAYEFAANEDYFLATPYVKRIQFTPSQNPLLALRQGDLDAAGPGTGISDGVPDRALAPFQSDDFEILTEPGEATRSLHFNLAAGFPYDDVRFRQAVAYAIDRQDLVDRLLFGRGEVGTMGGLSPSHPMLAPDLPTYDHDVAEAGRLLDEIGIVDADGDGMRDLPDGSAFQPVIQENNTYSPDTGRLVTEHLRAVGIDAQTQSLDGAAADAAASEGNYTMALVGYGGLGGDPDWMRFRMSSNVPGKPFFKIHGYNNPAFEEPAGRQLGTLDPEARAALVHEMQRVVAEDVPYISLYVGDRMWIYNPDVFDAWYYTPGAVFGLYPGPENKHAFVTGQREGLPQ